MQEQFPAGAWTARHPENEVILAWTDMPKMQEHFSAGA
jgi:hypothetical protein